jgi:tetratricopeptide (TPR) repeat protein
VRKSGSRVRITAQLIEAARGTHLWSQTFDRELTDVFAVQDEIARSVVGALKLKLLQAPTSKDRRTASTEAYNQYLLARQFLHLNNIDGFQRAAQAYEKAVALDPGYAPAWAGLALATFWVADSSDSLASVTAGQERAVAAAEKAIALGPDLSDGYLARGFVRVPIHWDWEGARADFARALALNPDNPEALMEYSATVLRALGQLSEAATLTRKAAELDPLNARVWSILGTTLAMSHQLGAAREAFNRSLELSPQQSFTPYNMSLTFLYEDQPAAALAASQRSPFEIYRLAGAAEAHHDLGHARESQHALAELIARFGHNAAYQIGQVYAWRGEKGACLPLAGARQGAARRRAREPQSGPPLTKLRGDPRYAELLKKMNLQPD